MIEECGTDRNGFNDIQDSSLYKFILLGGGPHKSSQNPWIPIQFWIFKVFLKLFHELLK